MVNPANQPGVCPGCGATVSSEALEGACPRCLARLTFPVDRAPKTGVPDPADSGSHFGDYELQEELGRGGMGVVYRARQRSLDRIVAVKMILSGRFAGPRAIERLRAEGAAAAAMQHPNIVAIHEIGQNAGLHYFTMAYVDGPSLAQVIADPGFDAGDFPRTARWVKTLADAIQYAHEQGILHRDLKPSNVLIDANDQPRITDFGLAKKLESPRLSPGGGPEDAACTELSLTGHPLGSPSFMPPEQAEGRRDAIGPASDVYGLGALLYQLLTGRAPFGAATIEATLAQVLHLDPVAPRTLNPDTPRDLENVCLKCLEKDPARRYASARQLADELGRFLAGQPVRARPVGPLERLGRWSVRRPAVAGLLAALVLSMIAGVATVLWQWRRAESHAHAESQQRRRAEALIDRVEFDHVDGLLQAGDAGAALARLARLLRWNPTNQVAAGRLMALLAQRPPAPMVWPAVQHEGPVTSARFSPDGRGLVTASHDGTARLWDAATGRPLGGSMRHQAGVRAVCFSPDGARVATASADKTARVWNTQTGEAAGSPLPHEGGVNSVEFSPSGEQLLTASTDGTVRLWTSIAAPIPSTLHVWRLDRPVNRAQFSPDGTLVSAVSGETVQLWTVSSRERRQRPWTHPRAVRSAQFSPDNQSLVTACEDGAVRLWTIGRSEGRILPIKHLGMASGVTFSPDGRFIASVGRDRAARLWDAKTGLPVGDALPHTTWVESAEFSEDGQHLITVARDNAASVWNVAQRTLVHFIPHPDPVTSATFSRDGQRLLTGTAGGQVRLIDLRPRAVAPVLLRQRGGVRFVEFSPDGTSIATAGQDGTAAVWAARTGAISVPALRHTNWVASVHYSPDGRHLLTAGAAGEAGLMEVATGREVIPRLRAGGRISEARFTPDGRLIATAGWDGSVRFWSALDGQADGRPIVHGGRVWSVDFSPEGERMTSASLERNSARIWSVRTRQSRGEPLRHDHFVYSARFSPDGMQVVSASEDQTARRWDGRTGRPIGQPLRHSAGVRHATYSPDGLRIATGSMDNTARLWETSTGRPLTEPLRHDAEVHHVRFSPDGRHLLTTSMDGTARLWDCATGHPVCEPLRHSERVMHGAFSPDGQWLATASADGTAAIWELPLLGGHPPRWLPDFAEGLASRRLNDEGMSEPVDDPVLGTWKTKLNREPLADPYVRWAQWMLSDRDTRPISPSSLITSPPAARD